MPLKRLGKPPYLLPDEVENNDLVEIIDKPYIVPAEQTKWGKEKGKVTVRILRTGDERRWTLNALCAEKHVSPVRTLASFAQAPKFFTYAPKRAVTGQLQMYVRMIGLHEDEYVCRCHYVEPFQRLPI